jgi:conflict system STAND superfamily ATPase
MLERTGIVKEKRSVYRSSSPLYSSMQRFYRARRRDYSVSPTGESPAERLTKSFTPHKPIQEPEFFQGRETMLYRAVDAVHTEGLHLVVFGDRGTGKTSLARVLAYTVQQPDEELGVRAIFVSCTPGDTYSSIWRKVFQEVYVAQRQLGFTQEAVAPIVGRLEVAEAIDNPNDVRHFVRSLPNPAVIVIDEFESVLDDEETNRLMASTIKLFADTGLHSTIVLVGVADSIENLFTEHHSIARNLGQVQVLPMETRELQQIVQRGFAFAGLGWSPGLDTKIARLSQGYPHYTHLLGLWSGRRALGGNRPLVTEADLDVAIVDALENATGGVQQQYEKAVASPRKTHLFKEVLLACALAEKDALGRFPAVNVRDPLKRITGKDYTTDAFQGHLAKFCDEQRGPVLKKSGYVRSYRWQFVNPQLIPFIRLEGLRTGLLQDS